MAQEIIRKGPWTEKEDYQLVFFVGMFGERRWDFIAKVSGLKVAGDNNRSGKSCRLRWVNYLHPGLKRGKLTPQEECLVLELQSKWGNRWSRIAHRLPGRTDNEIKNFWRTHMRKKAQEKKRDLSPSSSSSSSLNCSSSSLSNNPMLNALLTFTENGSESFYETAARTSSLTEKKIMGDELCVEGYPMDEIWKDIEILTEKENIKPAFEVCAEECYNFVCPAMASPMWEWKSEMIRTDEDNKMVGPVTGQFLSSSYEQKQMSLSDQYFSSYEEEQAYLSG